MLFFSDEWMLSVRWMNGLRNTIKVETFVLLADLFFFSQILIIFCVFFSLMNACFLRDGWIVQERNKGIRFYSSHESFLLLLDINTFLCFFFSDGWFLSVKLMKCLKNTINVQAFLLLAIFFFFSQIWIFCESFLLLPPVCNVVCLLSSSFLSMQFWCLVLVLIGKDYFFRLLVLWDEVDEEMVSFRVFLSKSNLKSNNSQQ